MDDIHKKILTENHLFLIENIRDVGAVCDHLLANDILTQAMVDDIMVCKG